MADGARIDASDIGLSDTAPLAARTGGAGELTGLLAGASLSLAAMERALVEEALRRTGWVQKDAAKLLGITRRKLNYMIARMGLTHPSWRRHRGAQGQDPAAPSLP
jgi:DNA-binding NtrC family response regulator